LIRPHTRGISIFGSQAILPISAQNRTEAATFDSLFTTASLSLTSSETNLVTPLPMTYEEYRDLRFAHDLHKEFVDQTVRGFKAAAEARSGQGIAIDVPFRIKSKTFRRIFGGDNIGLRVQGSITIDGKYRRQKFDEIQVANQRNTNNNFNIDMTQRFTIAGKIGEKVQVDVNQDSERLFEFENSLKLTYTGDEDEIIQKVEAGNVSLSLGTRLATFHGQNKGLFGLKTEAKVGALKITGIASLERGQKNKQKPNESARRATWSENDFLQNVYFWITNTAFDNRVVGDDTLSVSNYRESYRRLINRQHVAPPITLSEIEVWVSTTESGSQQGVQTSDGFAVALQNIDRLSLPESEIESGQQEVSGTFRRLTPQTDYEFDNVLGYIRLRTPLQANTALACAFRTSQGDEFGTMTAGIDGIRLILLKPKVAAPTDSTWNLMFRHVYSIQTANVDPENFAMQIIRGEDVGAQPEEGPDPGQSYLTFFQFDMTGANGNGGPDGKVDNLPEIFRPTLGEIHFLDLTPFNPSGIINGNTGVVEIPWDLASRETSIDSGGFLDSTLYTQVPTQIQQGGRKWRFVTEYQGSTSQFDLGPLVLEGSEEVTLNGQRLTRGSDYTIDYLSGQLKILNEAAKAPNADLEIAYESGQVFQLDRKTLLGARAEYELWQDSYIGGMVLHLNEKSLDRRVRIGSEPIRNTLYDLNTQLKFRPNFLTAIADRLPLVRTNVGSEFVVDGEVAKVFPNPNSLTNDATGDHNGVAFIDDFEASRRSIPLGMLRKNWTKSSIPTDPDIDSLRGRFRWWNPFGDEQVRVQEVFPEREVNSQVADRLQSLVLDFEPDTSTGNPEESWGGVMRYLGAGYEDQSRAQFLEFWIELPSPGRIQPNGKLIVDLGSISEDALPNDSMNTEDRPEPGEIVSSPRREYGNGVLSRDEDTGIDGVAGVDPADMAYWNGPTRPPIPSWDDWEYSVGSSNYAKINGTENSLNGDESSNIPDSEDLNGNNSLDQANAYFSYTIELNYNNEYIVGGQGNWRLFRIPFDTDDPRVLRVVGSPTLTNVQFARMYMTGMAQQTRIQIVQNDIVTNEWLPEYVDADSTDFVSVAVINNHENPEYYSPPGVAGEIDPITNLRQREQSLVLKINDLNGNPNSLNNQFFVAKNLFQQLNMIEYKRLKMFVHGGGGDEASFRDDKYQLILRIGTSFSNTEQNYYDIVKTIYKGWDVRNQIDVAMNDLSILSAWRQDSTRADFDTQRATTYGKFVVPIDTVLFPGDSLIINGRPSLQNVGFIALGVRATGKYFNNRDDEIWVDELRVSDIYKDPGTAGEVSMSLKIADLLTASGSFTQRDADFHNINTRTGDQRTSETIRGSLSMQLQKFGLEQYGFSLPVSVNRTETEEVPKYVPNTDARVNQANPDSTVITVQKTTTFTASYSKTGGSPNPLVRWTAEKLRLGWDRSESVRKDHLTLNQVQKTTNARAEYTVPTARGRGIAPIWYLEGVPLLTQLGNPHLFYKPRAMSGSLSGRRTQSVRKTRAGLVSESPDFIATGTGSIAFDITETLGTGMTQAYSWSQIDTVQRDTTGDGNIDAVFNSARQWKDIVNLNRRDLNSETWGWNNTYSPRLASWFAPNFNYTSTYSWARNRFGQNFNQPSRSETQNVANSANIGGDVSLDLKSILGGGGGGRQRGQRREQPQAPARRPVSGDGADSSAVDTTHQVVERQPGVSPLKILGKSLIPFKKTLSMLDPLQLSYDNSKSHAQTNITQPGWWKYRLGLSQDPNPDFVYSAPEDGGSQVISTASNTESNDYSARSGLRLSRDIRTTFAWNLRETESYSTTNTGSTDQTFFWIADDNGLLTEIPFADVTFDWGGLERLSFLSKVARTVSLNSGLSTRQREDWQTSRSRVTNRTYTRQWNPLAGISISWLNSIDTQLRINAANSFTHAVVGDLKQRSTTRGATGTVGYTMRTGFRLPILWFGAMRLENSTTFSLNLDYSTNVQERTQSAGANNWSTNRDEISWSVQPRVNYTFSSTVTGGAQIQYQQIKDKITDKGSTLFEFGINVNIAIRG